MNRREMFIRSGLGLVALSTLPALASIKSNQRNSYNIYNDKNVGKDPNDPLGAFMNYGMIHIKVTDKGPLHGKTFAIKDNIDLMGFPTGGGNPDWLNTHAIPMRSAPLVNSLLKAGATLIGKTHMDELAWSLMGKNFHYGTPINTNAPGRLPGGSSSGSASAVAGKAVDFAIGTDTGGSIRVPASFSGLYGLRPTHGRISLKGVIPLAPSFDTIGWFSRDANTIMAVGKVLLKDTQPINPVKKILIAKDMWSAAGSDVSMALNSNLELLIAKLGAPIEYINLGQNDELKQWGKAFSIIQSSEIWHELGSWVDENQPKFGPGISDRFKMAKQVQPEQIAQAKQLRSEVTQRLSKLVANDTILIYPTVPGISPKTDSSESELNAFRSKMLEMLCPAGFAGLPQMTIPAGLMQDCPVGLSVVGAKYKDLQLLSMAQLISPQGQK